MAKYNNGDRFDLGADGIVVVRGDFKQAGQTIYTCEYLDVAGQPKSPVNETELDNAPQA